MPFQGAGMRAPRLPEARAPLTVRPQEAVPREALIDPERSVDHDLGAMYPYQCIHYKTWMILNMTLSGQDSKKSFRGAEGIRWSLRQNSEMRTSAQDTYLTGPGVAHA